MAAMRDACSLQLFSSAALYNVCRTHLLFQKSSESHTQMVFTCKRQGKGCKQSVTTSPV